MNLLLGTKREIAPFAAVLPNLRLYALDFSGHGERTIPAQGVVGAYKNIGDIPVPTIVRLQGTNAVEAMELIDNSGLKAADRVKEVLK